MPSSRDRQRKLARAKLDRQMARRAVALRRRRQIQAAVGAALALLLVVLGSVWLFGGFSSEPKPTAASDECAWTTRSATDNSNLKDAGLPPTNGMPTTGTRPMTITTNQGGPVTVALDLAQAPCAGASFAHLAGKKFFDNTKCHELTTEGALRCGDPSGSGLGGPTYSFLSENVPSAPEPAPSASAAPPGTPPAYPKGTVALIGTPPGSNGSQFLVFLKDFGPAKPDYPVVGTVTAGLDVLDKIAKLATVDNGAGAKVKPAKDVLIKSLTVGDAAAPAPADGASQPPAADPAASPSARS